MTNWYKPFLPSDFNRWRFKPGGLIPLKTLVGVLFLSGILLLALLGPSIGHDPTKIDPNIPLMLPGEAGHWFGTDDLGRDLLSRIAVGAQISLLIGFMTAFISVGVGTAYGILSAWFEGRLDTLLMRFIDILYSLPGLMVVILFSIYMGRNIPSLILALTLFSWPDTARIIRGQVLALKREEFIEACTSVGITPFRLILRHFIPNLMGFMIMTGAITVPRVILTESTLSFIGLGVEPPLSSWGTLASEGWQLVRVAPHLLIIPSIFIVSTMIAFHFLGDSLQESTRQNNAS